MAKVKFDTANINGEEVTLFGLDTGKFEATVAGTVIVAPSLKALKAKIRTAGQRAAKMRKVEATILEEDRWNNKLMDFEDVVLTGVNNHTRRVTYVNLKGEASSLDYGDMLLRRLTGPEKGELVEMRRVMKAAEKAYEEKRNSYKISGEHELQKAMRETPEETEEVEV